MLNVSGGWHGSQREWIQPIRNGLRLMRVRSVTFSMLACHGKGWWSYTKAAFLSSQRHNFPSKVFLLNTLPAKDGDLRLSASNACLPETEISVFVTECGFLHPHVTNYMCSHCMMCYTVRKKNCPPLFGYKAMIVWFSQFITDDSSSKIGYFEPKTLAWDRLIPKNSWQSKC